MCPGALRCEVNGVDRAGSEMGTEINEIDHVLAALRWVRIQSHKPVSKGSRLAQASVCSGGCFPIAPAAQRIPQAFSSWRQAPHKASFGLQRASATLRRSGHMPAGHRRELVFNVRGACFNMLFNRGTHRSPRLGAPCGTACSVELGRRGVAGED